ncbi:MAG: Tfp pilus assembly protein PilF [Gammaproteobacteria bacterium]|jgi:Tfp pilus assembly protein PilF
MFANDASDNDVESALEQLLGSFKDDPQAHLFVARTRRARGNPEKAREHFAIASEKISATHRGLFAIAQSQFSLGDLEGAQNPLSKAGRANPDDLGILVLRASVMTQLKSYPQADTYIK